MPEFIPVHTPGALPDDFTTAYVNAIEWLLSDSDDNEHGISDRDAAEGFSDDAIEAAISICADFQQTYADALQAAYDTGYTPSQAGADFWLTRNHHGSGFWDRGLPWDLGQWLTYAALAYGECDSYVGDDNLIYLA